MREIWFRAWHPEHGEMVYSTAETLWEKREFYPFGFEVGFSHYPIGDWQIMQFTGLHDKNGREIYEDDGVRCGDHIYICRWNPHRAEFAWHSQDGSYIYPIGDMRTGLEVIGNIWEHPDLLEVPHA